MGLKDEWECTLDTSADATKYDLTNEALEIFYFSLCLFEFIEAVVANFSNERWVSEVSFSLVLFFEDLASWRFLKDEDSAIRRDFNFRLEVLDSTLEEEDKKVSVMLKEVVLLMIFSEIESLMLRSSWLKLTLLFEEYSSDEDVGTECEALRTWSGKEEEFGTSLLGNYVEEEVE